MQEERVQHEINIAFRRASILGNMKHSHSFTLCFTHMRIAEIDVTDVAHPKSGKMLSTVKLGRSNAIIPFSNRYDKKKFIQIYIVYRGWDNIKDIKAPSNKISLSPFLAIDSNINMYDTATHRINTIEGGNPIYA